MKVTYPRHQAALKSCPPIAMISGDDPLLQQETVDEFIAKAQSEGFTEIKRLQGDQTFQEAEFFSAIQPSLFNDQQTLLLHVEKWSASVISAIKHYLESPPPDIFLLLVGPKLTAAQTKSAWVKAIEQKGAWVVIWPIEARRFSDFIQTRARKLRLNFSNDAIQLLAARTEHNTLACMQELEKLALIATDELITADDLDQIVRQSACYTPFDLKDAVLSRNISQLEPILSVLEGQKVAVYFCLTTLCQALRQLSQVHAHLKTLPLHQACQKAGVYKQQTTLIEHALRYLNATQVEQHLKSAYECECTLKGLRKDSRDDWAIFKAWLMGVVA